MLDTVKCIEKYLADEFGAELAPNSECVNYLDKDEQLLCGFRFPDNSLRHKVIGRKESNEDLFPDLKLLFIYNQKNNEVFSRICQGEARGIPWETISYLFELLTGKK